MKSKVLFLSILLIPFFGLSQKVKLISGELAELASVNEFNLEIDFSNAKFYKENMTEKQFIEKRKEDVASNKDEAEAENWLKDWELQKSTKMYEKFIHAIEKKGKKGVAFKQDKTLKYTVIIQVDWIYPGYFAVAMKQPSKLNTTFIFVETANPKNEIAKLTCLNALGDAYPMGIANTNARITEAFDKAGVGLGKFMIKKFK